MPAHLAVHFCRFRSGKVAPDADGQCVHQASGILRLPQPGQSTLDPLDLIDQRCTSESISTAHQSIIKITILLILFPIVETHVLI
jgi:hypothetical protein